MDRLAKPTWQRGWRRELSVALGKVGDVQVAQGDLAGALKSYHDDLAIGERLVKADPTNAQWQYDVGIDEERSAISSWRRETSPVR